MSNSFFNFDEYTYMKDVPYFAYSNEMIYFNNKVYLLQERGTEKQEIVLYDNDISTTSLFFPLATEDFVIQAYNPKYYKFDRIEEPLNLRLLPPKNSHQVLNQLKHQNKIEYFLHSDFTNTISLHFDKKKLNVEMRDLNATLLDKTKVSLEYG